RGLGARVAQPREALEICTRLWTQERATFRGEHYRVVDAVCAPKPAQRPHPPIWVGGSGPRVMRTAARYADGFDIGRRGASGSGGCFLAVEEVQEARARRHEACRATR